MATLHIDHFRQACPDDATEFCLRILDSSDPAITAAADIAGFEHEWGFVYEVVVLVSEDELDDASSMRELDLVDVVSKTPIGDDARFELEMSPDFVQRVDARELELVDNTTAQCETEAICDAVVEALYEGSKFTLELSHATGRDGVFVAHGVELRR